MLKNKKLAVVSGIAAATAVAALCLAGSASAAAGGSAQPPKGARAVVNVSPNPTVRSGQAVTITGDCGGGSGLKTVIGGFPGQGILENLHIVSSDPHGFRATATISSQIGNGVGPVFVDCGGEAGVTLLVTHV
jgi:hypothetical protein